MSDPLNGESDAPTPDVADGAITPAPPQAEAELTAARAKATELGERIDKLEDEALAKPPHPASVGGMIGV